MALQRRPTAFRREGNRCALCRIGSHVLLLFKRRRLGGLHCVAPVVGRVALRLLRPMISAKGSCRDITDDATRGREREDTGRRAARFPMTRTSKSPRDSSDNWYMAS